MARAHPNAFFKAFRFLVAFGEGAALDAVSRLTQHPGVGLATCWSDPFHPELWLAVGHAENVPTLRARAQEELDRVRPSGIGFLSAWLLGADRTSSRRIDATFTGFRWLPLDLDAHEEGVAMETLVLLGVQYAPAVDDDTPPTTRVGT